MKSIKKTTVDTEQTDPAIGNELSTVFSVKRATQNQIIDQLVAIAHELDWAYYWKDAERHSNAVAALDEIKNIVRWRERHDR